MLTFSGNLIIAGSAECLFEDYDKVIKLFDKDEDKYDIMAINFSGLCFKKIVHLASLHADRIPAFLKVAQLDNGRHVHTHTRLGNLVIPGVENDWTAEIPSTSGSSALFGVRVGLRIGYDKIILCGVPLSKGRRFYDTLDYEAEIGDKSTFLGWKMANLPDKVKSMSSRTRDLLGEPTREWLTGDSS